MKFDDDRVDASQLQDQRGGRGGMSRGTAVGAGVGGVGILGLLLALLFGGALPQDTATPAAPAASSSSDVAVRCNQPGAIEQYDDCYIVKIFNETNEIWASQVSNYQRPTLVLFERGVRTACGPASSDTGPFYCPGDNKVYIDLGFMKQLQRQLGAEGRNAQAYIVAHEVGHHIQNITGTERRARQLQQQNRGRANEISVRLELQADCYGGVWARQANDRGNVQITQQELNEALNAAAAVGDDRIAQGAGQRVSPESFTHGTAAQRQAWFTKGFESGDPRVCDTFS